MRRAAARLFIDRILTDKALPWTYYPIISISAQAFLTELTNISGIHYAGTIISVPKTLALSMFVSSPELIMTKMAAFCLTVEGYVRDTALEAVWSLTGCNVDATLETVTTVVARHICDLDDVNDLILTKIATLRVVQEANYQAGEGDAPQIRRLVGSELDHLVRSHELIQIGVCYHLNCCRPLPAL